MYACSGSFNTKGYVQALRRTTLPPETHITYGGLFNQLSFSIGPVAKKPLQLHIGYARAQNQNSLFDSKIHDYLAIFAKGNKDGEDRDDRILNSVVLLDISGSMGSRLDRKHQGTRIQLAKEAIRMFFSKLRPNDSFGLVLFDQKPRTVIPVQKVSDLQFEQVTDIIKNISPGGSQNLMLAFNEANSSLKQYLAKANLPKDSFENRMVMLTDVCDTSMVPTDYCEFIKKVQAMNVHTTIIGVSSDFRSVICQMLIEVKGFNYFCATEVNDLKRYLFQNFSFTFFPSIYNMEIEIQNKNIKSIEVFGTVDSEKVSTYNTNAKDTFKVTQTKTLFPSELDINQQGQVKTYGGLMLVKLDLKDANKNVFDSTVRVKYNLKSGEKQVQQYAIHYQTPNDQFYSQESLSEALGAFFYSYESKSILKSIHSNKGKIQYDRYIETLEKMKDIVPKNKLQELDVLIKNLKNHEKESVKN